MNNLINKYNQYKKEIPEICAKELTNHNILKDGTKVTKRECHNRKLSFNNFIKWLEENDKK